MEFFRKIVELFMGRKFDIIKKVPLEISDVIFRMLDNRSLRTVAKVSQQWKVVSAYERKRRQRRRGTNRPADRFLNEPRIIPKTYNRTNLRF